MVSKEINLGTTALVLALLSVHTANGLCTSNCSACVLEYTPPFTVVYNASKARPDLAGQTFSISSSDSAGISNTVPKYFIIQGGIVKINNATNLSRNDIALNVFGNTILPVIYRFTVLVFTNPLASFSISICIQGLDNNIPTFPRSEVQIVVLEGTILSWPMDFAVDNDEGENSTQSYSILSNDSAVMSELYLDIARNSYNKITSILLSSNVSLDPGRKPNYNFTMVAQEGRPNTPKGYQKVYVIVQYLCNSLPTFEAPMYQISLPLSSPINTSVTTLRAVHMYSSTAAPIYYSIADICITGQLVQCSSNLRPFALNYTSGSLILTSALDYNQGRQFNITVVAKDACNLIGSTLVLVQITATPPIIQVVLSNNGSIREDYPLTSNVASVTASSPDHLNVSLVVLDNGTGKASDTFYLVSLGSSFQLRLLHTLNSKIMNSYIISIKASDSANNVVYSTFNITVLGVNHPPFFGNKTIFVSIPSITRNGTVILRVHASDDDLGENGRVTYELPPPNATFPYQRNFTINATSGDLMVNGILEMKSSNKFMLLIKARDNPTDGEPYLSDFMIVEVILVELPFAFFNASFTFEVEEGKPAGAVVGTISTSLSSTGQVLFTILDDSSLNGFALDPISGTITTKRALSAATGGYTLLIEATYYPTDKSVPTISIQQMVTINIIQPRQQISAGISPSTIAVAASVASSVTLAVTSVLVAVFFVSCVLRRQKRTGSFTVKTPDEEQTQPKVTSCEQIDMATQPSEKVPELAPPPEQSHACEPICAHSCQQSSPSCQISSPSKGKRMPVIRSTSDLASTVCTEILGDSEDKEPYKSDQLAAIYAANAKLLQAGGSQDSVHMFGSEGGFEVDEVDIDQSYFDDDENDDSGESTQNHSQRSGHNAGLSSCLEKSNESQGMPEMAYHNFAQCTNPLQNLIKHGSQPVLVQRHRWPVPYLDLSHASHGHHSHSYSCDAHSGLYKTQYSTSLSIDQMQANAARTSTPLHNMEQHGCEPFSRSQVPTLRISNSMTNSEFIPSHLMSFHNDIHSSTPPSASPTDDGIVSSITATQRAPERYFSNLSLGSTHLS